MKEKRQRVKKKWKRKKDECMKGIKIKEMKGKVFQEKTRKN